MRNRLARSKSGARKKISDRVDRKPVSSIELLNDAVVVGECAFLVLWILGYFVPMVRFCRAKKA